MKGWQDYGFPHIELLSFYEVDYALNYALKERSFLSSNPTELPTKDQLEAFTWDNMYMFDYALRILCSTFSKDTTSSNYDNRWDIDSLFQTVAIEGGFGNDEIEAIAPYQLNDMAHKRMRRSDIRLAAWGKSRMMMLNHLRYVPDLFSHRPIGIVYDITYYTGVSDIQFDDGSTDLPLHEELIQTHPSRRSWEYLTPGFWARRAYIPKSIKINVSPFLYDKIKVYFNIGDLNINPEFMRFTTFDSNMQFGLNEYVLDANGTIPLLNAPPVLNSTTYPGRDIYYGYRIKEIFYDYYDAFKFG